MITYLKHPTGEKREKTPFSGIFMFFDARYLGNRASYEKSKLTLIKSKFCEESENEVKKPLRGSEDAFLEHLSFLF